MTTPVPPPPAAVPPPPKSFFSRIKSVKESDLFVLLTLLLGAASAGWGAHKELAPADRDLKDCESKLDAMHDAGAPAQAAATEAPRIPVTLPLRVGVLGPLQGPLEHMGRSHLRGITAGLLHGMDELCGKHVDSNGDWAQAFSIRVHDDSRLSGSTQADALRRLFFDAQSQDDVLFGPLSSGEALDATVRSNQPLKIPTILTLAATPDVRNSPQYGDKLFQLANNIDGYVKQLVRYFGDFANPSVRHITCIYIDTDYGRSTYEAVGRATAPYAGKLDYHGVLLRERLGTESPSAYLTYVRSLLPQRPGGGNKKNPNDQLVILVSLGSDFIGTMTEVRRGFGPGTRIATPTSLSVIELQTGAFDGVYLMYSYAPRLFSVNTLAFLRYVGQADVILTDLLTAEYGPFQWHDPDTVDAEAHDAALYWFSRFVAPRMTPSCATDGQRAYVTNLVVSGEGRELGNHGALYLFRGTAKGMESVEVGP